MKILMVNKFLFPNGGSETYVFKLGKYLEQQGHKVQYFGMEHVGRCVGNEANAYTQNMDFHGGNLFSKLTYPIKTVYSIEARKKIRHVLNAFKPDVVHLNNFNYQLTPSIILEIVKWRELEKHNCKIIYTAHDYQLVCPNHMCSNPNTHNNCEKCLEGNFGSCVRGRCIHGSLLKSLIGTIEATYWRMRGVYKYIDTIICCSDFMKKMMNSNPIFQDKTITIHNFTDFEMPRDVKKENYVLYFGRYVEEKGIKTMLKAVKELQDIPFVFAGKGPLEVEVESMKNGKNVGFKMGDELKQLIASARFTVFPSEWYEPFGLAIIESMKLGTPVIGAATGGVSELIIDGENGSLFEPGNEVQLVEAISQLWNDKEKLDKLTYACKNVQIMTIEKYAEIICGVYRA